jgi:hypothetical protein
VVPGVLEPLPVESEHHGVPLELREVGRRGRNRRRVGASAPLGVDGAVTVPVDLEGEPVGGGRIQPNVPDRVEPGEVVPDDESGIPASFAPTASR